jgi:hypothetical protein
MVVLLKGGKGKKRDSGGQDSAHAAPGQKAAKIINLRLFHMNYRCQISRKNYPRSLTGAANPKQAVRVGLARPNDCH